MSGMKYYVYAGEDRSVYVYVKRMYLWSWNNLSNRGPKWELRR